MKCFHLPRRGKLSHTIELTWCLLKYFLNIFKYMHWHLRIHSSRTRLLTYYKCHHLKLLYNMVSKLRITTCTDSLSLDTRGLLKWIFFQVVACTVAITWWQTSPGYTLRHTAVANSSKVSRLRLILSMPWVCHHLNSSDCFLLGCSRLNKPSNKLWGNFPDSRRFTRRW